MSGSRSTLSAKRGYAKRPKRKLDDRKNDRKIVSWLRRNATAEKDPKARAALIEAHNAALKIIEDRD